MITHENNSFHLSGKGFSYVLRIDGNGKPVLDHFGPSIPQGESLDSLIPQPPLPKGRSAILDEKKEPSLALADACNEFSCPFRGDNENPSIVLEKGGATFDFRYASFEIRPAVPLKSLPTPRGGEELILTLLDQERAVKLELHYFLYEEEGVLGRSIVLENLDGDDLVLKKAMSYQVALENRDYLLETYFGNWAGEFQKEETPVGHMGYFFGSDTGSSGPGRNPFFLLKEKKSTHDYGYVYGFQLLYSGSFRAEVQENSFSRIRVTAGVSPLGFSLSLKPGERFESPLGLFTFSDRGSDAVSEAFASFSRGRVLPLSHQDELRPIVYNNWEGTYFDFSEAKLLRLARKAKKLGIELFVLDDGWFGKRFDDTSSLGDYSLCKKKLPHGLRSLSRKIHKMGLQFGLWVEPEAVSPDSDLYRAHPDWAIQDGVHGPVLGRHELLLDLTKTEVRDYLFNELTRVFEEAEVDFVKWDYNRELADVPTTNAFPFRYMLGLYDLLSRIRERFPRLWMENCASGGSRNDLGMLSFFDTCWVSDNTDSFCRASIQTNMAKGYPQCVFSNHVSNKTSHQMLRKTSLDTKFDVACLGVLGYELNLSELDPIDEAEIKKQIAFYKEHRALFQFGKIEILEQKEGGRTAVFVSKGEEAATFLFYGIAPTNPGEETLPVGILEDEALYSYDVRREDISFLRFGSLINMVSPVRLKEEGKIVHFLSRRKAMPSEDFSGTAQGKTLRSGGVKLGQQWNANGLSSSTRVLGDFGARVYLLRKEAAD